MAERDEDFKWAEVVPWPKDGSLEAHVQAIAARILSHELRLLRLESKLKDLEVKNA